MSEEEFMFGLLNDFEDHEHLETQAGLTKHHFIEDVPRNVLYSDQGQMLEETYGVLKPFAVHDAHYAIGDDIKFLQGAINEN